jgi:hypothetical protein
MLFSVGMYLPLGTTFAIFCGGAIRGIVDRIRDKRGYNAAQKARVENAGVLAASGLIAGEALVGLLFAGLAVANLKYDSWLPNWSPVFPAPFGFSLLVFVVIGWVLIRVPLANAGRPEDPAPPSAMV